MHLITMSAEVAPLANNRRTLYKNGGGFWVSNYFGYGLMNAWNIVNMAKNAQKVPVKNTCIVTVTITEPIFFNYAFDADIDFETLACKGGQEEVNYLEHIALSSEVEYPCGGKLRFILGHLQVNAKKFYQGLVRKLTLKLRGTKEMLVHYNKKREYAAFRLPKGLTN